MRAVKAKALRRALGFKPRAEREYNVPATRAVHGNDGKPKGWITGTITCKGVRGQYKKIKRHRVLTAAILRAGIAGAL